MFGKSPGASLKEQAHSDSPQDHCTCDRNTGSTTRVVPVALTETAVAIDGEPVVRLPDASIGQGRHNGQQDRLKACPGEHVIPTSSRTDARRYTHDNEGIAR
jgi:hypothetical protein